MHYERNSDSILQKTKSAKAMLSLFVTKVFNYIEMWILFPQKDRSAMKAMLILFQEKGFTMKALLIPFPRKMNVHYESNAVT